jgi:hypothetical protein
MPRLTRDSLNSIPLRAQGLFSNIENITVIDYKTSVNPSNEILIQNETLRTIRENDAVVSNKNINIYKNRINLQVNESLINKYMLNERIKVTIKLVKSYKVC